MVLIADGQDVIGGAGEQFDDFVLGDVRVLVLVHLDIVPLAMEPGQEAVGGGQLFLGQLQEADGFGEQPAEVDGIGGMQSLEVVLHDGEIFGGEFLLEDELFQRFIGSRLSRQLLIDTFGHVGPLCPVAPGPGPHRVLRAP